MRKKVIQTEFEVFPSKHDLPEQARVLMDAAVESRDKAYAPYSKFRVGAALLLASGDIVVGNNQENAAFPSGLCAERVAVFHAGATHPGEAVVALAITAASEGRKVAEAIPPCGACRQALAEYEYRQQRPMEVYFMGDDTEVYRSASVVNLLPLIFSGKTLTGEE